jgi:Short C-terminal domain
MGLIGGIARTAVVAGTATAVSNRVSRRQANRWSRDDQSAYYQDPQPQYAQPTYAQPAYAPPQYAAPAAPPPPAVPSATDNMLEDLRELGKLKEQGILTDEEFATQKARILGT